MRKISCFVFLLLCCSNAQSQTFISDSVMTILVESGYASKNFIPEGKLKKGERIGTWIDYSFEFILVYVQNPNETIDESFEHLLIQSTGKYSNNQKNGVWKFNAIDETTYQKYHIADVTYKNGKKEGPITLYYSEGTKASAGTCSNDLLDGAFTIYYKSGEVERKYISVKDHIQGRLTYYYKTGEEKMTIDLIDGRRNGEMIGYYKNGDVKSRRTYKNGIVQDTCWFYYPNGKVQEESIYKNGEVTHLKYYYDSGQLWVSKEYKDGNYHNVLELYDSSGKPLDFGTLLNGTGTVKYYTEKATVYLITTYENGQIVNEERFE